MSSSSWQAWREPLSSLPPQPRAPAWLPVLASEMSPLTMDEPWGLRCGGPGGGGEVQCVLRIHTTPLLKSPGAPQAQISSPAPSDTAERFPPGGAHMFLCFPMESLQLHAAEGQRSKAPCYTLHD